MAGSDTNSSPRVERPTVDRALAWAESAIYAIVAVLLLAGALGVLVDGARQYVEDIGDSVLSAATGLLSSLLLVFVFVELLGAVRVTIRERKLVAEPFLLVGIIASIKEIVVVAGAEQSDHPPFAEFRDSMVEVSVLALVVLVLSIAALLLRRKEREPSEEHSAG